MSRLLTWLELTEDRLKSTLSRPGEDKSEIDQSLRDAQHLQGEVSRKKPELNALMANVQVTAFLCLLSMWHLHSMAQLNVL